MRILCNLPIVLFLKRCYNKYVIKRKVSQGVKYRALAERAKKFLLIKIKK